MWRIEIGSDRIDKGKAAQRDCCRSLCVMCGCGERQREAELSEQGRCHEAIWGVDSDRLPLSTRESAETLSSFLYSGAPPPSRRFTKQSSTLAVMPQIKGSVSG